MNAPAQCPTTYALAVKAALEWAFSDPHGDITQKPQQTKKGPDNFTAVLVSDFLQKPSEKPPHQLWKMDAAAPAGGHQ